MGKTVKVHDEGRDKYGRKLGRMEIEGQDVNRQMVDDGMAWHYSRFNNDARLAAAQRQARAAKRGLWADAKPVPPVGMAGDGEGSQGPACRTVGAPSRFVPA